MGEIHFWHYLESRVCHRSCESCVIAYSLPLKLASWMIPAVASTHWPSSSKWRQISLAFICRTPRRKDEKDEKGEKREGSQRKNVLRISLRGNIIVQECENDGYWSRHGNGCSTAASQRGVLWIKSATEVTSQRHTLGLESRGVWFIRRQKVAGRCCFVI